MIVGVFSDLHSNVFALDEMLGREKVDLWISLGDMVGLFPCPAVVLTRVMARGVRALKGDHEECLCSGVEMTHSFTGNLTLALQRRSLSPEHVAFVQALPDSMELTVDGCTIAGTHRLPLPAGSTVNKYQIDLAGVDELYPNADVVFFGHTHLPVVCNTRRLVLANPGSAGFPIDRRKLPSYMVLDTRSGDVRLEYFDFDRQRLLDAIVESGYPTKLHDFVRSGFRWS